MFRRTFLRHLVIVGILTACNERVSAQTADMPRLGRHYPLYFDFKQLLQCLFMPVDMKEFQKPMTLKEALERLEEQAARREEDFPVIVTVHAFDEFYKNDVRDLKVKFTGKPRWVTGARFLRLVLDQLPARDCALVVRDCFQITTLRDAQLRADTQFHLRLDHLVFRPIVRYCAGLAGLRVIFPNDFDSPIGGGRRGPVKDAAGP